jgi:hypothetical protein
MSIHFYSLFVMFCSGIAAATIVDFIRTMLAHLNVQAIRKLSAVIEIVVWAFLGCATFYLLMYLKDGDWRAVDAIAQITGIYVYHSFLRGIVRFIGSIMYKIFVLPILWIVHLFVSIVQKCVRIVIRILKIVKNLLGINVKDRKKRISK